MQDKIRIAQAVRRAKTIARIIGVGLLAYGLYLSAGHITEIGLWLRLSDFEARTLFVLVDVVCLFGKLLTAPRYFVAKTRRIGYRLMALGGMLSLACNVLAGVLHGGVGRAGYGAFVVTMIVVIEYAAANIKGKTIATEPRTPRAPAPVKAGGRKCQLGCTCGKHASRYPVSPGVGPVGSYAGPRA